MALNPLTRRKLNRFRSIKRGYYSLLIILVLIFSSLFAELIVNNRALIVYANGRFYFPSYGEMIPGTTFGLAYDYETDYRALARQFRSAGGGDWVLMPPVPYNPYENHLREGQFPPFPPSFPETT